MGDIEIILNLRIKQTHKAYIASFVKKVFISIQRDEAKHFTTEINHSDNLSYTINTYTTHTILSCNIIYEIIDYITQYIYITLRTTHLFRQWFPTLMILISAA